MPISEHWPYLGIFAVLIGASLGLPIPEDIPLLTGGWFCHRGFANVFAMIGVGMAGVLAGDVILFTFGRRFGHRVVEHRFVRRIVNRRRLLMAEQLFARHGVKIIFAGRFMPGLRPMIFMAAGVLRVPYATFLAVNGFAACISVPTLIVLGKVFGDNLAMIQSEVRKVTHIVAVVLVIVGLICFGLYWHRRQKRMLAGAGLNGQINIDALVHAPPDGGTRPHSPSPSSDVGTVAETPGKA